MEVKFTDSFYESLKTLVKHQQLHWRIWHYIKYDIPMGIKNLIYFFPTIWKFKSWDYTSNLELFGKSLAPLRETIKNGNEVEVNRDKKVIAINRVIEIINNICQDKYIELSEEHFGQDLNSDFLFNEKDEPAEIREMNGKICDFARELEEKENHELWQILKGQDNSLFVDIKDDDTWDNLYDGSNIRRWWA
jgi:hypothetical protein